MFYGRKISPAIDMLKSTLLYIKQGLNTHIGAFSPVIIIEDLIYRVLFTHSDKLKDLLDECAQSFTEEPKNMVIKTVAGYQKLYFHEIEYAEAQNKKVFFHLRSGNIVESVEPFHSFEDRFTDADGFFKCHRSYFVYLQNVDHFTATEITTKSGRNIPVSRGYAKAFKEAYFSQMFQD